MLTSQSNYEELDVILEENEQEKAERLNRLRAAEIRQRFAEIDRERIRPLAAVVAGTANDDDEDKLAKLEAEAITLRDELAALEV